MGSGEELIKFEYLNADKKKIQRSHVFEGVIPTMERRYHETDSQSVREELAKYLTVNLCQECGGTRLRLEARNVFLQGKSLPEITAMPIKQCLQFFTT